jgi:hypothetical protein
MDCGQKVGSRQVLCGKDAIHRFQRKLAPVMQKVGEMGLAKAGLAGQQRDAYRPALYPPEQFQAEALVHLGKIHVWKIRHEQYLAKGSYFFWQS